MRVKHYVMIKHDSENKPAPMLCFRPTSNNIARAPNTVEGTLKRFEIALKTAFQAEKHSTPPTS